MNRILEIVKNNKEESSRKKERYKKLFEKKEGKKDKVDGRRNFRLEKIKEATAKAYAVATKRKWLVFLIGIALIAYLVISQGGLGLGILDKVKGLF